MSYFNFQTVSNPERESVINQRTRIVSFRLSEEEYQRLSETFPRYNARSVSDMVREALVRLSNNSSDSTAGSVQSLRRQIGRLEMKVKRMTAMLEQALRLQPSGRRETPHSQTNGKIGRYALSGSSHASPSRVGKSAARGARNQAVA